MLIESLERRTLFATTMVPISGNTVTFNGNDSTTTPEQWQLTSAANFVYVTNLRTGNVDFQTASALPANGVVIVNLGKGNDYVRLRLSDGNFAVPFAANISGGDGNDTIYSGNGADTINGGDGNDRIAGYLGADTINGQAGFDTVDYSFMSAGVSVNLSDANFSAGSAGEGDKISNTEGILGGLGNDNLIGNGNANAIDGGGGNDTIYGGGGNDTLTGGAGVDLIYGEGGADFMFAKDVIGEQLAGGDGTDSAQIDAGLDTAASITATGLASAFASLLSGGSVGTLDDPSYPGDLDITFDGDGKMTIWDGGVGVDDTPEYIHIAKVLTQTVFVDDTPEEKIYIVGDTTFNDQDSTELFVMRLNPDGSLDTTYGEYVEGDLRKGFAVADFQQITDTDEGGYPIAEASAADAILDSGGNVVIAADVFLNYGEGGDYEVGIAKFTNLGDHDESFGEFYVDTDLSSGMATYDFQEHYGEGAYVYRTYAAGLVSQGSFDGDNYVIAATVSVNGSDGVGLVQFDSAGNVNDSFTSVTINSTQNYEAVGIVSDYAGNFWVAANSIPTNSISAAATTDDRVTLLGYDQYGSQFTFYRYSEFGNHVNSIAIYGSAIVMAGDSTVVSDNGPMAMLARADVYGTSDGYGLFNQYLTHISTDVPVTSFEFNDVTIDGEGRGIAVGTVEQEDSGNDFVTFRFDIYGLYGDSEFNNGSAFAITDIDPETPFPPSQDYGYAVAVDSDGKIIVAGLHTGTDSVDLDGIAVVRYNGGTFSPPPAEIAETVYPGDLPPGTLFTYEDPEGNTGTLPEYYTNRLLEVDLADDGTLTINGTESDDYIVVTQTLDESSNPVIKVQINDEHYFYNPAELTAVNVNSFGGNDEIHVDDTLTVPLHVLAGNDNDTVYMGPQPDGNGQVSEDLPPVGNSTVLLEGEDGDDHFIISVARNGATVTGGNGNDTFDVYPVQVVVSGAGLSVAAAPSSSYVQNQPVTITPGPNGDIVHIHGTSLDDAFTITDTYVEGAGQKVFYGDAEKVIIDGDAGNDTFNFVSKRTGTIYQTDDDPYEEVVDNNTAGKVTVTGAWTLSTYDATKYGPNYLHDGQTKKGTKSVKYTPTLPSDGQYEVFAYWAASNNRSTNTPYVIQTANGPVTVRVNQRTPGTQAVSLGVYDLLASTASVTIRTDGTTGYVVADAVKFSKKTAVPPPTSVDPIVIDDQAAVLTGSWTKSTWSTQFFGPGYRHDGNASKGKKTAAFIPSISEAGTYKVYARWVSSNDRASNVPYKITYANGQTKTIIVNQKVNGGNWVLLDTLPFDQGTGGSVVVSNAGTNGFVTIDAFKWELA